MKIGTIKYGVGHPTNCPPNQQVEGAVLRRVLKRGTPQSCWLKGRVTWHSAPIKGRLTASPVFLTLPGHSFLYLQSQWIESFVRLTVNLRSLCCHLFLILGVLLTMWYGSFPAWPLPPIDFYLILFGGLVYQLGDSQSAFTGLGYNLQACWNGLIGAKLTCTWIEVLD